MTKKKRLEDWWPPLGIRATWLEPRFTARESTLLGALDALVRHDNAADERKVCSLEGVGATAMSGFHPLADIFSDG
jgi:hypothetical protein